MIRSEFQCILAAAPGRVKVADPKNRSAGEIAQPHTSLRLARSGNARRSSQVRSQALPAVREMYCPIPHWVLPPEGGRGGVADGVRTHDNRNHNPGLYR
jgi:hypothetical protein